MSSSNADIRSTDMGQEMQENAIECAKQAIGAYEIESQIAKYIKNEFDAKFKPNWHCIVGSDFDPDHLIYFYLDQLAILLYKTSS
ncbi:hypothetical protein KR059_004780 [Drosophila kikkawai]|nr:hypothetical protein KR059_004780 [Drosophila kikkawai]